MNPLTLVKLVQNAPKTYGLAGANKLRFNCPLDSLEARRVFVDDLLKTLSGDHHA